MKIFSLSVVVGGIQTDSASIHSLHIYDQADIGSEAMFEFFFNAYRLTANSARDLIPIKIQFKAFQHGTRLCCPSRRSPIRNQRDSRPMPKKHFSVFGTFCLFFIIHAPQQHTTLLGGSTQKSSSIFAVEKKNIFSYFVPRRYILKLRRSSFIPE